MTVLKPEDEVIGGLREVLKITAVESGAGRQGYSMSVKLRRDDRTICTVLMGGRKVMPPHVIGSGSNAPEVVAALREKFSGSMYATRLDVALDWNFPEAFEYFQAIAEGISAASSVNLNVAGDWLSPREKSRGRTVYLGGLKGRTSLVRVYERGILIGGDRDLVRVELEVHPRGPARYRAAQCAPWELFGFGAWPREFARQINMGEVEPVIQFEPKEPEPMVTLRHMVWQYRKVLEWLREQEGNPESAGVALWQLLDAVKRERRRKQS